MTCPSDDDATLPDLASILGAGPFKCRCGVTIEHWGDCDACSAKYLAEQLELRLRPARASIPAHFRWASFSAPELRQRVSQDAIRRASELRPPRAGVALIGASGAGKTSLACAILRRLHDSAKPDSQERVIDRAAGARFVAALDIEAAGKAVSRFGPPNAEAEKLLAQAHGAAVLVVDNVEPGKLDGAVGQLVMARHDAHLCTIVTTWMSEAEAAKSYGAGWARRVYETTVDLPVAKSAQLRAVNS